MSESKIVLPRPSDFPRNVQMMSERTPAPGEAPELWSALPRATIDRKAAAANRIVTVGRTDATHAAFDRLRTKIYQLCLQSNWTSVAITSPTAGCGKTLVALNLAFSLAHQKNCRTVVVDLDLRRPKMATLLATQSPPELALFLRGTAGLKDVFARYADNLAIAVNAKPVRFAAELLQSPDTARTIRSIKEQLAPDIIVFDLPPMLATDDVMAFLPQVDCAVLIAAAEASTHAEVDLCESELSQQTNLLGVVLNKCRYPPETYGY